MSMVAHKVGAWIRFKVKELPMPMCVRFVVRMAIGVALIILLPLNEEYGVKGWRRDNLESSSSTQQCGRSMNENREIGLPNLAILSLGVVWTTYFLMRLLSWVIALTNLMFLSMLAILLKSMDLMNMRNAMLEDAKGQLIKSWKTGKEKTCMKWHSVLTTCRKHLRPLSPTWIRCCEINGRVKELQDLLKNQIKQNSVDQRSSFQNTENQKVLEREGKPQVMLPIEMQREVLKALLKNDLSKRFFSFSGGVLRLDIHGWAVRKCCCPASIRELANDVVSLMIIGNKRCVVVTCCKPECSCNTVAMMVRGSIADFDEKNNSDYVTGMCERTRDNKIRGYRYSMFVDFKTNDEDTAGLSCENKGTVVMCFRVGDADDEEQDSDSE